MDAECRKLKKLGICRRVATVTDTVGTSAIFDEGKVQTESPVICWNIHETDIDKAVAHADEIEDTDFCTCSEAMVAGFDSLEAVDSFENFKGFKGGRQTIME